MTVARVVLSAAILLTPAWGQWKAITNAAAPSADRAPAIAASAGGDVLTGGGDRIIRIAGDGGIRWNHQLPVSRIVAVAPTPDDGLFAVGWAEAVAGSVFRLDAQGNVVGTYDIRGAQPSAIVVDSSGSAFITGWAGEGFAPTPGAWKVEFGSRRCAVSHSPLVACRDAFVVKLNADSTLAWATLLGGSWNDQGRGIAVDREGAVWVTGETISDDFPTTSNAFDRSFHGRLAVGPLEYGDAFLARLDRDGRQLLYATYLGGTGVDYANAIVATDSGVIVTGATQSSDFPMSADAHQPAYSGDITGLPDAALDAFIVDFAISGERRYATYYGNVNVRDYGTAAALGTNGTVGIALAGRTESCAVHYEPVSRNIREECFQLGLNDPLALVFANGMWIAAGRTMQGHEVPGVDIVPRLVVQPLSGIGDNSGPAVVGLWNEYIAIRRPLVGQGSVISIYQNGIGSAGAANTSVRLGDRDLTSLYAGADQINAVLPMDMPVGLYSLTVGMRAFQTIPIAVDVIERWPGLSSGAINEDGTVNSELSPARLGSVVSLFGNGAGPEPLPVIEPYIQSIAANNAQGMQVLYAGRAPDAPEGIFQVNARIPMNAQTGNVPVRLVFRVEGGFLQTPLAYIWVR